MCRSSRHWPSLIRRSRPISRRCEVMMSTHSIESPPMEPVPRGNVNGAGWKRAMSAMKRREAITAYLFLSPALILFVVFIAGPLIGAIVLSLFQWDLLTPARFSGLGNYVKLLSDPVV